MSPYHFARHHRLSSLHLSLSLTTAADEDTPPLTATVVSWNAGDSPPLNLFFFLRRDSLFSDRCDRPTTTNPLVQWCDDEEERAGARQSRRWSLAAVEVNISQCPSSVSRFDKLSVVYQKVRVTTQSRGDSGFNFSFSSVRFCSVNPRSTGQNRVQVKLGQPSVKPGQPVKH
ncbi:hypothetical protein HanPSC8_Chr09g0401401 [Helianthus annuus]|nr:hypothetical protein HanPSC8_Chr09g0401401 [Helianthus annuus]